MRYFLLSSKFCEVFINGEFLGNASKNLALLPVKNDFSLNLIPSFPFKRVFARIKNGVTNHPNIRIIDLYGDFLILPTFEKETFNAFEIFFDEIFNGNLRVSVLMDGYLKIMLENTFGVSVVPLKFNYGKIITKATTVNNFLIITVSQNEDEELLIFNVSDKPVCVFKDTANTILQKNNGFFLSKKSHFINIDKIEKCITFNPFECKTSFLRKTAINNLPQKLIPYAFLQEVQHGFDFFEYLTNELKENSNYVKDFLGDFFTFTPTFSHSQNLNREQIILIGSVAKILTVTLDNALIADLNLN